MSLKALVWAGAVLGTIKLVFSFFGWLLESEDHVLRRHLDGVWDRLHSTSLHEAVLDLLNKVHSRLSSVFEDKKSYKIFFVACLFVNYVCSVLALAFIGSLGQFGFIESIRYINVLGHIGLLFLSSILSLIDCASLGFTLQLLRRVDSRTSVSQILMHSVLQWGLIACSFVLAMACLHFVTEPRRYVVEHDFPGAYVWVVLRRIPELVAAIPGRPFEYLLLLSIITATAAAATLVYILLVVGLLVMWPRWSWYLIRRSIFVLTTDKSPVLTQIGSFLGGIGAIVTFIVKAG